MSYGWKPGRPSNGLPRRDWIGAELPIGGRVVALAAGLFAPMRLKNGGFWLINDTALYEATL